MKPRKRNALLSFASSLALNIPILTNVLKSAFWQDSNGTSIDIAWTWAGK